jgi:hypothetical protein
MPPPPVIDVFAETPPTDQQLARILARGRLRTRLVNLFVGGLAGGLGLVMLALIGLELDPEVRHMSMAGKLVGVAFGGLFCLVGLGMGGIALLGRGGGGARLQRRLEQAPESVERARRLVSTANGIQDPGTVDMIGSHILVVTADDDSEVRVMMSRDDVSAVLRWVARRVPTARIEGQ